jgi:hypothetical protein
MPSSGLDKKKQGGGDVCIRVDGVEGSNAMQIIVFFLAFLFKHSVHCATGNSIGTESRTASFLDIEPDLRSVYCRGYVSSFVAYHPIRI